MAAGFTAREIAQELNARVDKYATQLLPDAIRDGNYWVAGSADGEKGHSLKLNRTGPKRGLWKDFNGKSSAPASGDMLSLAAYSKFANNLGHAIAWAKSELGMDDLDPKRIAETKRVLAREYQAARLEEARERERKHRAAWMLWRYGEPIAGTPALAYLEGRGIDFAALGKIPGVLRYRPDCWCRERRGKYPAMLAAVLSLEGKHLATHRTFLDVSGSGVTKARIAEPKVTLGKYQGGHIPLWKGTCDKTLRKIAGDTPVYVSEGIEDGLSVAFVNRELRVIAGVSLDNIGGLELPEQAGPLVIVGQNDSQMQAVDSLERAVQRQQYAGRKVQMIFPPYGFKDFNDWLNGKRMAA